MKSPSMHSCVVTALAFAAISALSAPSTRAGQTDDFSDGDWNDGSPIQWSVADGSDSDATITAEGSLRLDSSSGLIRIGATSATDTASIRTQVRIVSSFAALSFPSQGHWVVLEANGQLAIGQGNDEFLASAQTSLNPLNEDVILQMDWIDNTISAWAWSAGDPPASEEPHLEYVTTRTRSFPSFFTNFGAIADFRSVTISDQHLLVAVPEPSSIALFVVLSTISLMSTKRFSR